MGQKGKKLNKQPLSPTYNTAGYPALLLLPALNLFFFGQWQLALVTIGFAGVWWGFTAARKSLLFGQAADCLCKKLGPADQAGIWHMPPLLGLELRVVPVCQKVILDDKGGSMTVVRSIRFDLPGLAAETHQTKTPTQPITTDADDDLDLAQITANLKLQHAVTTQFDHWHLGDQEIFINQVLPTRGNLAEHLEALIDQAPTRIHKELKVLAAMDWDHTLAQAEHRIKDADLQAALLRLYRDLPENPSLKHFISRQHDQFAESNRLVAILLLGLAPTATEYRAIATTPYPLLQEVMVGYCAHQPAAMHLIWGGAFGNINAATRLLNLFPLAHDPLAVPHLIACVHLPYLRREILAQLVKSQDPRVLGWFRHLLDQGETDLVRTAAEYLAEHDQRDVLEALHHAHARAGGRTRAVLEQAITKVKARFPRSEHPGALSPIDPTTTAGQLSSAENEGDSGQLNGVRDPR